MDHVFNEEFSIAQFADAASRYLIATWFLFLLKELASLLHTIFATGQPAELAM